MSTVEAQNGGGAITHKKKTKKQSGLVWDNVTSELNVRSSEEVLHVWFVSNWCLNKYNHTHTLSSIHKHTHREHHRAFHTQVHYKNQICTAWSGFRKVGVRGAGVGRGLGDSRRLTGVWEEEAVTEALLIIGERCLKKEGAELYGGWRLEEEEVR